MYVAVDRDNRMNEKLTLVCTFGLHVERSNTCAWATRGGGGGEREGGGKGGGGAAGERSW